MDIQQKFNHRFRHKSSGVLETAPCGGSPAYVNLASADLFYPEKPLPQSVQKAMLERLGDPYVAHYQECLGNRELREVIAGRLKKRYGAAVDPGQNILATPGSEVGLLASILLFLEPGDEVLIPDPSYSTNFQYVRLAGGVPVSIPLREETGFQLELEYMEASLTEKTKAVILTHPNNPTGTVYTRETIEALCRFVVRNDLILICDMAFEDHIYEGKELLWPAACPGMWERTVSLFTASKGFGLCGLRVGYLVADTPVLDSLLAEATPLLCSANVLAQIGTMAALRDEELHREIFLRLDERRQRTCRMLAQVPGVSVVPPGGGIQCWVNVAALGDSAEIVDYLREQAGVLVSDGASYGPQCGKGHFRLIFGCVEDDAVYYDAVERLCEALKHYPER